MKGWNQSTLFSYNDVVKNFFSKLPIYQWIIIAIAIVVDVFIIVNACLPAGPSSEESGWVVSVLSSIINGIKPDTINPNNVDSFSSVVRKLIGHFSLFVVGGVFTTLSIKYIYYNFKQRFVIFVIISCISGLFLAFLTELIQLFVPGRSGEMRDVFIDFSGYIIPVLIICLITYLKRKETSSLENEK